MLNLRKGDWVINPNGQRGTVVSIHVDSVTRTIDGYYVELLEGDNLREKFMKREQLRLVVEYMVEDGVIFDVEGV